MIRMCACVVVMGQSLLIDFNTFIRRPRPLVPAALRFPAVKLVVHLETCFHLIAVQ